MSKVFRNSYFWIFSISSLFYIVLSAFVHKNTFKNLDYSTMTGLQDKLPRILDVPFSVFSLIGTSEVTTVLIIIFFLWLIFFKKRFFLGIFLYFLAFIIEILGKIYIFQPKPPDIFYRYAFDLTMPSGLFIHTNFSYPSGHMIRSMFISAIAIFFINKFGKNIRQKRFFSGIIVFLFLIMFVSRIYLGEHWLSDVFGGSLLGLSIASLSLLFYVL